MQRNSQNNRRPVTMHKKSGGVSVIVVIVLVIVVIAVGVGIGFLIGRGTGSKPQAADNNGIQVSSVEAVSVTGTPEETSDDVFAQEISGVNEEGLDILSGEGITEDTIAVLSGADDFESAGMKVAEDDSTVVAEYEGGKLYRGEVAEAYNDQLAAYLFEGYNEQDISEELLAATMQDMILERLIDAQAEKRGLTTMTDEERAAIEKEASTEYAEQVAFYVDFVREDGMTDEEATKGAEQFLEEYEGITYEETYNGTVKEAVVQKLYNELTKDISVTEEDVRAAYDDAMAIQKSTYEESAENYELDQLSGEVIVYNLPNYRAIKIINTYLQDGPMLEMMELTDELYELNPASDAARIAEINARIEELYTEPVARAQAAMDRVKGGEDFDTVYAQCSEDLDFVDDNLRRTGYFISEGSVLYDEETISAAMALKNPGDISEVIRTEGGASILKYVGNVAAGEVAYEDVHDALKQSALSTAKDIEFDNICAQWLEEAKPVYYTDRMF